MTMGIIVDIDADKFLVDNNFATHGDSGIFDFIVDRVVVGLITGKFVMGPELKFLAF